MDTLELYNLTTWIQNSIVDKQIPQLYKNLLVKLRNNTQPNQPQQEFEQEKNSLIEAITDIPIYKLTYQQKSILDELNVNPFISEEGKTYIEDILFRHGLDMATAANKIQEAQKSINEAISKSNAVRESISSFVDLGSPVNDNEKYSMRVCFKEDAGIHNFVNMKKWSTEWWSISRGITRALDKSPEDIEIVSVANGSIIIDLLLDYGTIIIFSKIIKEGLEITERILSIKKLAAEIKQKGFENEAAKKLLEGAEKEKEDKIDKIVNQISVEININNNTSGDKITELKKAVEKLVGFLDKGGDVDFIPPQIENVSDDDEGELSPSMKKIQKERIKLRERFEEIRKIDSQVKQLTKDE